MMRPILIAAALLSLAGCGGGSDPMPQPTPSALPQAVPGTVPADNSVVADPAADNSVVGVGTGNGANEAAAVPVEPDRVNADGTLAAIPAAWHGRWAGQGGSCADSSERRLDVEGERLVFYESVAVPQRIERASGRELTLDLGFSGEGESWTRRATLVVSDDGRTMRRSEDGTPIITYTRCPAAS